MHRSIRGDVRFFTGFSNSEWQIENRQSKIGNLKSKIRYGYAISLGCPVHDSTVLQNLPLGSIFFRLEVAIRMGT